MKKLLIATTALVATAGIAAAEVAVSGNGRMGVVYSDSDGDGDNELNFSSRIRVGFTLSGETDGGLSFGGSFRADNAGGAANGSAGSIFISGAFGKLEMGDVVGAAEAVLFDLPEVGFQDLGNNDTWFLTGDTTNGSQTQANNPSALYTYTTGGLTFALSMNDGNAAGQAFGSPVGAAVDTQEYALGVKYAFGDYSVGIAYESADPSIAGLPTIKHLILGGSATFGTTTVSAYYGDLDAGIFGDGKHYGLGVESTFDALTVKGFVKREEMPTGLSVPFPEITYYGLGADYALGGGATLSGGIADDDIPGSKVTADFGIKFTF